MSNYIPLIKFENLQDEKITITIDCVVAISVIGNIQLARRHPKNDGPAGKIAEAFARNLQTMVAEKRPETAAVMEMGWNKDYDI